MEWDNSSMTKQCYDDKTIMSATRLRRALR